MTNELSQQEIIDKFENTNTVVKPCPPLKPLCLSRPRPDSTKRDASDNIIVPIIEEDCDKNKYEPGKELTLFTKLLEKSPIPDQIPRDSNANCYSVELAWFIVIKDIINNNNDTIKKISNFPTTDASHLTEEKKEEMKKKVNEQIDASIKELDPSTIKGIHLQQCFNEIINYGINQWNMGDARESISNENKAEDSITLYATTKNGITIEFTKNGMSPNPSIDSNLDMKNDIIAFILLKKLYQLVNAKGFTIFSNLLDNPTVLAEITKSVINETPEPGVTSTKDSMINTITKMNEVFKMTLFLMNEKTELTNFYNDAKMNKDKGRTINDIYSIINNTFLEIEELFVNFEKISEKKPELKLADKKIVQSAGGSKTIVLSFAKMYAVEMIKGQAYSAIWTAVQGAWYSFWLPLMPALGILVPWVNIAVMAIGICLLVYKSVKLYKKWKNTAKQLTKSKIRKEAEKEKTTDQKKEKLQEEINKLERKIEVAEIKEAEEEKKKIEEKLNKDKNTFENAMFNYEKQNLIKNDNKIEEIAQTAINNSTAIVINPTDDKNTKKFYQIVNNVIEANNVFKTDSINFEGIIKKIEELNEKRKYNTEEEEEEEEGGGRQNKTKRRTKRKKKTKRLKKKVGGRKKTRRGKKRKYRTIRR